MPPKIVLIRPDGTRLEADREQASKLALLGYKEETPEERSTLLREDAKEEFYSSTEQQVYTGLEGLGRGASLGLTDYAFGDERTTARAQYNPGIAAATELAGAVAADFVPGVNLIAPAAIVGRGARAITSGTSAGARLVRGAVEGGAFGGAMAADHAYLAGDPITSEAVLHGIGWGSLFGAGMAGAGSLLGARGAKNIERGAKLEAEAAVRARSTLSAPGSYEAAAAPAFTGFRAEASRVSDELKRSITTTEALLSGNKKQLAQLGIERSVDAGTLGKARIELDGAFRKVSKAMNKAKFNPQQLEQTIGAYEETVAKVAEKAGIAATGSGKAALMEYAQAKVIQKELAKFPRTAVEFAGMSDGRAEQLIGTLNAAKKMSNYSNAAAVLEGQANKLQEALGMQPSGVDGLRAAWKAARASLKAEKTAPPSTPAEPSRPGIARRVISSVAGAGGYAATTAVVPGHPFLSLGVGATIRRKLMEVGIPKTPELIAARNQSLGRIKQAVGKYQVGTGKAMTVAGPRIAASLATKLDGTPDNSSKDAGTLAMNRISEFASAAPHIRDTLYRAVEPILVEQPELGPALHETGVQAFQAMRGMLPTDPGVVSGLKPIWKPSSLQAAVMGRQLAVWQDPIGSAEDMLFSGQFDPIGVKALKEIAPAVYETLRVEMIGRLQSGMLEKMDYRQQVALGALLEIPIHSSMKPEYIAASQALHASRNEPLPTPAIPGSTNGGRPAGDTPGATAAQITTSR